MSGLAVVLPEPKPGLVFRYDYLWSAQHAAGVEPSKERPACLLAAIDLASGPRFVVILPITHSPPAGHVVGIEIPLKVGHALGLDDRRKWIIVSEHNVDEWPNSGLAQIPHRPGEFSYGFIPPGLFGRVREKFLELAALGRSAGVRR